MAFVAPETWRRWKDLCSVGACDPDQRQQLHSLFCPNLREALERLHAGVPTNNTDADLAALADEYFKPGSEETGPRTKDAIFRRFAHLEAREGEWASCATAYFRRALSNANSAAAYIAKRHGRTGPFRANISAHDAIAEAQLDPGIAPDALACVSELPEIAARLAPGFFVVLNQRQKAVLWAVSEGLTVDSPEVLAIAGCGKSTLSNVRNALADEIRNQLCRTFITQAPEELAVLALEIAKAMLPLAKKWRLSGKTSA